MRGLKFDAAKQVFAREGFLIWASSTDQTGMDISGNAATCSLIWGCSAGTIRITRVIQKGQESRVETA
jgi:hypothetical protein